MLNLMAWHGMAYILCAKNSQRYLDSISDMISIVPNYSLDNSMVFLKFYFSTNTISKRSPEIFFEKLYLKNYIMKN